MSEYQKGIINRYYEHRDTIMLDRLGQIVSDLYLGEGGKSTDKLWQTASDALAKTDANPVRIKKILADRDVKALAQLVSELQVPSSQGKKNSEPTATAPPIDKAPVPQPAANTAPAPAAVSAPPSAGGGAGVPTADDLKMALKAFRKRLKLTRLDEESKLGRSPLSAGKKSQVVAIIPPNQFPRTVWEELAKQGKLKNAGRGFYELVGE